MTNNDFVTMLVVAAGSGRRFGGSLPKQYQILNRRPVLWHTLSRLHANPIISQIVPVIAPDGQDLWRTTMTPLLHTLPKVSTPVLGGKERQESVFNGLKALNLPQSAWVGIHDGARPLLDNPLLHRLFLHRRYADAVVVALPASDTVKIVNSEGYIIKTVDRNRVWLAQTPQIFRFDLIFRAHTQAFSQNFSGTDDASLVEWLGEPVQVVQGSHQNIKITQSSDLSKAEWLLAGETPP